ncbi:MAG TPA: hypothetical protein VFA52_04215 [Candidatus Paceibacterota bacterium]|nr:hypothetical protein [Candidatus Paceibacterota bacterium]
MLKFVLVVVGFAVGFGVGRIKNAAKLSKIREVVSKFESGLIADAKSVINKIKQHI